MFDKELYSGRFGHISDRKLNSVRLFVSSTFSDTIEERNRLIEYVYPKLREYCSTKYQIQFQYSDMRWDIPSTASNTHATVDMCLQELDTCCRLSMATNCVIFLSHRYGSCLPPACIPYHIFQLFLKNLSINDEERKFLFNMYQLDENYLDKRYYLRSITVDQQSNLSEMKLQNILRKSAQNCYEQNLITKDERDEFFISVIAKEIYRALKNNQNQSRRIVCFFREIYDMNKVDSKFYDMENQELLEEIKNFLHRSITSSDIYTYQFEWTDEIKRNEYFSQFVNDFYEAIRSQIDFHLNHFEKQRKDVLYNHILEHAIQCNLLIQRYFPRNDLLEQVKSYITSISHVPCVLFGESETGKSSFMAKLVYEIPKWFSESDSVSIIIRFLGATPASNDLRRPFISVIEQICTLYQLAMPINFDNIQETLENLLAIIPMTEKLILLFDSIDQLEINILKDLSRWLPRKFPLISIKYILSTISELEIDNETIDIRSQLRNIYENKLIEIDIKSFERIQADNVLQYWLEQDRRCLTDIQYEWLKPKIILRQSITPLFLSLLYDQTLTWHSYDQIPDKHFLSIKNTTDAIEYFYKQLGIKHGDILFRHSIRYLQLSGGLSENEIEDILSLDDEVLQSIFVHYLPPLKIFRIPSTFWIRIRIDMQKYLIAKDIDQIPCIYFYHRSFQYYQPMNIKQLRKDTEEKRILDENRLSYYGNQWKNIFDMSYSTKLMQKYNLTSNLIEVNRCLTKQKKFNLRRIHQLYLNMNRYDYVHRWTVFNYDFLFAYLLCGEYKMSNFLHQFAIGTHNSNGELRFLLKQFEFSFDILDRYPENLAFELIYRLYSFRNQLPDLIRNLLQQCFDHCPLQLITDTQRLQCLGKYVCLKIFFLSIDQHRLVILTNENQLSSFSYDYYGLFRTESMKINCENEFDSFVCRYPYICCLSLKQNLMFSINCQDKQIFKQNFVEKLIEFIDHETILYISSRNKKNSLELFNCSKNILISEYIFSDNLISNCIYRYSIIQVNFQQSSIISYLILDNDYQFQLIRTRNENLNHHTHQILLNKNLELFYSFNRSQASLIIYQDEQSKKVLNNIDFQTSPQSVLYLSQSQSIIWLTSTSLSIFHPLIKHKIYQPFRISLTIEYDLVHDRYSGEEFLDQTYFLACMNRTKQLIDIYEWNYKLEEKKFQYRLLTRFQLQISIEQFVFRANWSDGLTIFCSDGSNLYKYNATMITYLLSKKMFISSETIHEMPSVHSNEYLVLKDNQNNIKILTINDNQMLEYKLSLTKIEDYYFTQKSSHILIIDDKHNLIIYSLKTLELVWTTDQFQSEKFQIHSLSSSFLIISLQTKQILSIDTDTFKLEILTKLPVDCLFSTITSNHRLYFISVDQSTLGEYNLNENTLQILPPITLNTKKIQQFRSVYHHLIIQTDDQQISLWKKRTEQILQLEKASKFCSKDNRLVLISSDNRMMISYDLKENLRGTIHLDEQIGECRTIDLTKKISDKEQYLFFIGEDRFLRIFTISNGKQLAKIFIENNLQSFIGILKDYVLLKVENDLCWMKIIKQKLEEKESSKTPCSLFEQSMWMICHQENCTWSNAKIS